MINMKTPCMNCADRKVGCHGFCKDYAEYQQECERIHRNEKKQHAYDSLKFRPDHVRNKKDKNKKKH